MRLLRRGGSLPDRVVTRAVDVDLGRLAAYNRVCGFRLRDELPATYPHVLAFPLAVELMRDREFPFPVLGLVHIANRIEVVRPPVVADRLELRVWAADLGPHPRGTQFTMHSSAAVGRTVVWREQSTYLRRSGSGSGSRRDDSPPPRFGAVWDVPGDIGRRYARVSGDWNPIHLHGLSARVFGQKGAIAHGMWTLARCLGALDSVLPDSFVVSARFRKPVTVPGRVGFSWADGSFGVWDVHSRVPCLTGTSH
jgi:hypothetical protein